MRAQNHALPVVVIGEIERVVLLTGWMFGRNVQRRKIMPVVLNVGAFGHREAHFAEDGDDFVGRLADGMNAAFLFGTDRQGYIDLFFHQLGVDGGLGKDGFPSLEHSGNLVFQRVQRRAGILAFGRVHSAEALHHLCDAAFFAQRRNPKLFKRVRVGGGLDRTNQFRTQGSKIFHVISHHSSSHSKPSGGPNSGSRKNPRTETRIYAVSGSAERACSTNALNESGSRTAKSANTFRSIWMPARNNPFMNWE